MSMIFSHRLPTTWLLSGLIALFSATAMAQERPSAAPKVVVFEDVKFAPPNMAPSAQIRVLSGQPDTGPSAMYLRFVKQSIPMHVHTADYHLLVVEGTMKHWSQGESEDGARLLGPGSYWFQPGSQVHADACVSETCLLYLVWLGPRDGRPAPIQATR